MHFKGIKCDHFSLKKHPTMPTTTMPGGHRDCWRWRRRGRLWRWILSSYADLFAPALAHCWVRPAKLLHELAIWDWWGEPKRAAFQQLFFFTCSDGTIQDLWFFNLSGLFLQKGLWCLLFAYVPVDSWTAQIYNHVCTKAMVSQLPLVRFALGWIVSCQEPERWERIYQKQQQLAAQAKYRHPHKPMGCAQTGF